MIDFEIFKPVLMSNRVFLWFFCAFSLKIMVICGLNIKISGNDTGFFRKQVSPNLELNFHVLLSVRLGRLCLFHPVLQGLHDFETSS